MATKEIKKDCDCISKCAEKIKEKVLDSESKKQKGYSIISADWEHRSWYPTARLYTNFIIQSTFEKKDGTTSKPKNSHTSIYFSFCPFCGEKFQ